MKETKTVMLRIRVTEAEAERYRKMAQKANITVSELIRKSLDRQTIVVIPQGDDIKEAANNIIRVGNMIKKIENDFGKIWITVAKYQTNPAIQKKAIEKLKEKMADFEEQRKELVSQATKLRESFMARKVKIYHGDFEDKG